VSTVRLFAAVAEAYGADEVRINVADVAALRAQLSERSADAERIVPQCAVLRDGHRLDDEATLADTDVVDVLPPFAGG